MSARHAGRVAVITGGSSGIGQAIVLRLVQEGARVAILDVADSAETVTLAQRSGGTAVGFRCDISSYDDVTAQAARVRAALGDPAIAIHCAAMQFMKPFAELTVQEWRATHQVNVDGGFHLAKSFLPAMQAARRNSRRPP